MKTGQTQTQPVFCWVGKSKPRADPFFGRVGLDGSKTGQINRPARVFLPLARTISYWAYNQVRIQHTGSFHLIYIRMGQVLRIQTPGQAQVYAVQRL